MKTTPTTKTTDLKPTAAEEALAAERAKEAEQKDKDEAEAEENKHTLARVAEDVRAAVDDLKRAQTRVLTVKSRGAVTQGARIRANELAVAIASLMATLTRVEGG